MANAEETSSLWLPFALATVLAWGLYGVFLHVGQVSMADPVHGRYKAFFCVGLAYFLIAVLAPAGFLLAGHASWSMPAKGLVWSVLAGSVGAIGAFCVLLAFGAKGQPAVVMSIIFAGAPLVNAVVSMAMHPPAGGWTGLRPQFLVGILLAALGGTLVTLYKPGPAAKAAGSGTPGAAEEAAR